MQVQFVFGLSLRLAYSVLLTPVHLAWNHTSQSSHWIAFFYFSGSLSSIHCRDPSLGPDFRKCRPTVVLDMKQNDKKNLSFQTWRQNRSLAGTVGHSRRISSHKAFLTRFQRDQNRIRLSTGFHR